MEKKVVFQAIPSAIFTYPPLATVGLTEEAAEAQGLRFRKLAATWPEGPNTGASA
jgi:pyruvate/2-oxoglutarate dehydrogenase complex dihydrolipoamide dehydrogenase (E3) component